MTRTGNLSAPRLLHSCGVPCSIKRPVKFRFSSFVYLWRHVVCDAELQVCEDALHAVEGLLPGGPQVFLHGPGHRGEDGLSRLPGIHHFPRVLGGRGDLVFVQTLDVRERLFHRHDQPTKWGLEKGVADKTHNVNI